MVGHNIQAILIMDKGGIPQFLMKLDPTTTDLDPMLVSGFFTAVQTFSREVIEKGASEFQVDYGARLFTVISCEHLDLVSVSVGAWLESMTPVLSSLLRRYESEWLKLSTNEKDTLDIHNSFNEFREEVIQNLSFREVSPTWVPFIINSDSTPSIEGDTYLAPYIDGMRSIEGIIMQSGLQRDDVISEISRLWAIGVISFRSIIDNSDIVISTSRINRLLQTSSPERSELERLHPDIVPVLPRLAGLFDGRKTVDNIVKSLSKQYDERDLIQALDYLLEVNAIEALSSEKRRILLVKESFDIALRVAEKIYSSKMAYDYLEKAMRNVSVPEVVGEIKHTENRWWVDYESRLHEGLDPKRLMDLYSEWMSLLAQFVKLLDTNKIKKYVAALVGVYSTYLLNRYSEQDLRGFEEFAFWLETITASVR